jgi:hypothetical protein
LVRLISLLSIAVSILRLAAPRPFGRVLGGGGLVFTLALFLVALLGVGAGLGGGFFATVLFGLGGLFALLGFGAGLFLLLLFGLRGRRERHHAHERKATKQAQRDHQTPHPSRHHSGYLKGPVPRGAPDRGTLPDGPCSLGPVG